jgi:2-desacetyl-2-hydroxyethyl bacteriochlorophyllide A dehydrogenase
MQCAYLFAPRDLRFIEREPLPLGPDDVRIEVAASGICGTDLHVYSGFVLGAPPKGPVPFGHEFSGRIAELGSAVMGFEIGERVTALPNTPCGKCVLCRSGRAPVCRQRVGLKSGSWAPSLVAPAQNVFSLPDNVSDRLGALTEPLACAVRAVDHAEIRVGDRVCVIGAGPIGLGTAMIAQAAGAQTIIVSEPRAYRRELAKKVGADHTIDPTATDLTQAARELTDGLGADVVFEAVGHPKTIEQAIAVAAPGATIVVIGVANADARADFPAQVFYDKEITLKGTRGPTFAVERTLRWLSKLDFEPVLTHTFPIHQANDAIQLGLTGDTGKILLVP